VDQIAPVHAVRDIHAPVFISHGTADRVIPYQEAQALHAAANPPKELWIEEGVGHTELREYQTERYHQRVREFLEKLQAPAPAR
jgi:uncharacterized protein